MLHAEYREDIFVTYKKYI